ncbi:hypothetical protein SUDANB145_03988 [Streptomyces sp. enrichment culture]|uniref:hypothetical protein n=1 Tax=Streptomyces sp. enrichment culture TaxID=1795815 RepID=UPI003F56A00A
MTALASTTASTTAFVIAFEEFLHWRYGAGGLLGLLLLTVGVKSRRPSVSSAGAVLLALLVSRPAL